MRKLLEKCQLNSLSDSDNAEHTDGKRSLYVPVKDVESIQRHRSDSQTDEKPSL